MEIYVYITYLCEDLGRSFIFVRKLCYHRNTWLLYGIFSGQKYKTEDDSNM